MPKLDHVNIEARDGPRMVAFLEKILDATDGPRPPFDFPGNWIYVDGQPAIHLNIVERGEDFPQGIVNHVAFGVYDFETAEARIKAAGYPYKITGIPATGIGQFFVTGPEGVRVEVQFKREIPG